MRTFSCFITDEGSQTPVLSFIIAETEQRARELARRELLDARRPVAVELCEGLTVLWSQKFGSGAPGRETRAAA